MLILMRPEIPQNIVKLNFSLYNKKSNLLIPRGQISDLCVTCFISHALTPVDNGLKVGQFWGFLDILTATTSILYIVLPSKLKLKLIIWKEFLREILSDSTNK